MHVRRLVAIVCLLSFQLAVMPGAVAQEAPVASQQVDLNLSSTDRNLAAGQYQGFSEATIDVGGAQRTVTAADLVTAAELVAISQVVMGGAQTLELGSLGNAVGGSFQLTGALSAMASALTVPEGVSTVYDAGVAGALNLSGNLTNSGGFYAVSSNPLVTEAVLSAANIVNNQSALISTVLDSQVLALASNLVANLSLVLNAKGNIANAGTITSAGNLTASAGGSLINALPPNAGGPLPAMQAAGLLNLQSASMVNAGTLSSLTANINMAGLAATNLALNNAGGRLQALDGAVNVRDVLFSGKADFSLSGGDVVARELNVYTGSGVALINVNELAGVVNIYGGEAHIAAATENLALGAIELTGDPTFFNTQGDVTISTSLNYAGQNLAVVASGDIVTATAGLQINTSSAAGNGGNVLMVAGAQVVNTGAALEISDSLLAGGGSASGGKIDLGSKPISNFTTRGGTASGAGAGGTVTLIAYAGSAAGSGTVRLPGGISFLTAGGGGLASRNGDVTVIAGGAPGAGNAITAGFVQTTGGQAGTGNITLATARPEIAGGPVIVDTVTGAVSGGLFRAGAAQAGSIQTGNLQSAGAAIDVLAGANATLGALSSIGSGGGSSGGSITVRANAAVDTGLPFTIGGGSSCSNCTAGSMQATAATSGASGNGGAVSVYNYGSGGIRVVSPFFPSVPVLTLNGNGGKVTLDAAAGAVAGPLELPGGTFTANAAGNGSGGQIILRGSLLTGSGSWNLQARGAGTGSGGTVSIQTTSPAAAISFGSAPGQIAAINVAGGLAGGSAGSVSLTAARSLSVASPPVTARSLSLSSTAGDVQATLGSFAGTVSGRAAGSFKVSAAGPLLNVGDLEAGNGSIEVSASSGQIRLAPGAAIRASEGDIDIRNNDQAAGSIVIGLGATLSAESEGEVLGRIRVSIGPAPASPQSGVAPPGFTVSASHGGKVYFGQSGISAQAAGNAANVDGSAVVFDTGLLPSSAITLAGSATFNATAKSPVVPLSSLDLTDPEIVDLVLALQDGGHVGGSLAVAGGVAVGGSLVLTPDDLEPVLSAANLPANVVMTMLGFTGETPLTISLTEASTTPQVSIAGRQEFVAPGGSSQAAVSIVSTLAGPVLVIAAGGSLSSDGLLSVTADGDIDISGSVSAGELSLNSTAGGIAIGGTVSAGSSAALAASGSITCLTGVLASPSLTLASLSGSLGAAGQPVHTLAGQLSLSAGPAASAYISQTGGVVVASATAGSLLSIAASGPLATAGALSAQSVQVTTSGGHSITLGGDIVAQGEAGIESSGSIIWQEGRIHAAHARLASNAGDIGTAASPLLTAAGSLTVSAAGTACLSELDDLVLNDSRSGGAFSLRTGGSLQLSSITTGLGSISLSAGAGSLTVAPRSYIHANEGNITLANSDAAGGTIEVGRLSTLFAYTRGDPDGGNIVLTVGDLPASVARGPRPRYVVAIGIFGGKIHYGVNGISTAGPLNLLLALGRDITFNTGGRPAAAIHLGGGVAIIADPPPPASPLPSGYESAGRQSPAAPLFWTGLPASCAARSALSWHDAIGPDLFDRLAARDVLPAGRGEEEPARPSAGRRQAEGDVLPSPYRPIAFVPAPGYIRTAEPFTVVTTSRATLAFTCESSIAEAEGGTFILRSGETFVRARDRLRLTAAGVTVELAGGAEALISASTAGVSIRNLYEGRAAMVRAVLPSGESTCVAAGRELLVAPDQDGLVAIRQADGIGRRRLRQYTTGARCHVSIAEISLPSLVMASSLLRQLSRSERPAERALLDRTLKTAACLMLTGQSHGPYSQRW